MSVTVDQGVQARIASLWVYPIKSCAGVSLAEAVLTETGLDLDRAWMVVDAEGEFISQRECPRMALIQPIIKSQELVLKAPGMLALHLAIDQVEQAVRVRVWDDEVKAYDMGDLAAQWFTDFLGLSASGLPSAAGNKYRLVRFDPDHKRLSSLDWTGGIEAPNQFSDGYPLLVVSQASLDGLNARLQAAAQSAVTMERFRPNIVLTELEAHDEDRIDAFAIATDEGAVRLLPVKPCPRCPIPNIDPKTAISSPEVGDMLQSYRQDRRVKGAVTFGMNAIVAQGADTVLKVGQNVSGHYRFE
jgi:uncharacterized protein